MAIYGLMLTYVFAQGMSYIRVINMSFCLFVCVCFVFFPITTKDDLEGNLVLWDRVERHGYTGGYELEILEGHSSSQCGHSMSPLKHFI